MTSYPVYSLNDILNYAATSPSGTCAIPGDHAKLLGAPILKNILDQALAAYPNLSVQINPTSKALMIGLKKYDIAHHMPLENE